MSQRQLPIIVALGTTQTLAWASSYYLPAILADPIGARCRRVLELDLRRVLGVAGDFGAAWPADRAPDRSGRRPVGAVDLQSDACGGTGAAWLHLFDSVLLLAWLLLGIGMGFGLYDAAFGALGRIYGEAARRSITGITLIAGFASTVGWPLTALGLEHIGWRNTCFAWAAAHILIGLPINFFMLPAVQGAKAAVANAVKPHIPIDRTMVLLAFAFAAAWTVTGAMAAHFPRILEAAGATTAAGDCGRRADRPGAGRGAHCRGGFPQPLSSAGLDAPRLPHPSDRRGRSSASSAAARPARSRFSTAPATAS